MMAFPALKKLVAIEAKNRFGKEMVLLSQSVQLKEMRMLQGPQKVKAEDLF